MCQPWWLEPIEGLLCVGLDGCRPEGLLCVCLVAVAHGGLLCVSLGGLSQGRQYVQKH